MRKTDISWLLNTPITHRGLFDENYPEIRADILKKFKNDKTILSAMEKGKGIRILRQDAWETIISFIISQNNNIPRIKKIISSLSERFGEKIYVGNDVYYSFPTARSLYDAGKTKFLHSKRDLEPLTYMMLQKKLSRASLI